MEISSLIKNIKTLNNYISVTHSLKNEYSDTKPELNLSTVLSLKNVRSLEIEFFNKCDDSGAAFVTLDRLLTLPSSKSWSLFGKEIVTLLQYWLDAVRKHLINHHIHWWNFLKHILNFVRALTSKDTSMNNILLEYTTDSLLDLATRGKLDVYQRHEVLYTLNLYCMECSKDMRYVLRGQFEHYFVRLSTIMASCGHVPTQCSVLETLVRWLVKRRDPAARAMAASRWLPAHLYAGHVSQMFVDRPWHNFFQDVRDFLNAHNATGDHVTSVVCRKLCVGSRVLISRSERHTAWLDFSMAQRCVSALLEPRCLTGPAGLTGPTGPTGPARPALHWRALCLSADRAASATLHRDTTEVTISITSTEPPQLCPAAAGEAFGPSDLMLTAVISSRNDMVKLDAVLGAMFGDKYQVLFDIDDLSSLSPRREPSRRSDEDETRFSHASKDVRRRRHAGFISSRPVSLRSPSTASTTSLAQLHDKLAALPRYTFDKEPVGVCVTPALSEVTELTETDLDRTFKLRACDFKVFRAQPTGSQSDSEILRKSKATDSSDADDKHSDTAVKTYKTTAEKSRRFEEILDEDSTSRLLVTTIGSADQSVINDTLERLAKDNECRPDNIVDLLVKEALEFKREDVIIDRQDVISDREDVILDSGINTLGDCRKTQDSEVIENTYDDSNVNIRSKERRVVSKSTSDESNTEVVAETPISYVSVRKKNYRRKSCSLSSVQKNEEHRKVAETSFEVDAVEDFFSQHLRHTNEVGDLVISPSLARKMNASSSESSDAFDQDLEADFDANVRPEFLDVDVIECLNDMVDKVCQGFEKCSEYLNIKDTERDIMNIPKMSEKAAIEPLQNIAKTMKEAEAAVEKPKGKRKHVQSIQLNFKTANKKMPIRQKVKNKLQFEPAKMSTIMEVNTEVSDISVRNAIPENTNKQSTEYNTDVQTPLPRRKRNTVERDLYAQNKITENVKNQPRKSETDSETPLLRRKRKLYSPKNDENIDFNKNEHQIDEVGEKKQEPRNDGYDITLAELKQSNSKTELATASTYKEIEQERQKFRRLRSRKPAIATSSPKTKKNNDLFDMLKVNIEGGEKITTAVDKDVGIFNFTSDSEDEDFKNKKVELQKRVSTTTIESGNSVISTRRRPRSKVSYVENDNSTDEPSKGTAKRKRPVRRQKSKSTSKRIAVETPILIDERMRDRPAEVHDTSFVLDKSNHTKVMEEMDPAILAPQIELIIENENEINLDTAPKLCDEDIKIVKKEKRKKSKILNKELKVRSSNEKIQLNTVAKVKNYGDDEGSTSPLPGLVVEKVIEEIDEGSITTNLVRKLKRIYKEGPDAISDVNTTQNLLSDLEKTNMSLPMNASQEINDMISLNFGIDENIGQPEVSSQKNSIKKVLSPTIEIINATAVNEDNANVDVLSDDKSVASSTTFRKKRSLRLKSRNSQVTRTTAKEKCNPKQKDKDISLDRNKLQPDKRKHLSSSQISPIEDVMSVREKNIKTKLSSKILPIDNVIVVEDSNSKTKSASQISPIADLFPIKERNSKTSLVKPLETIRISDATKSEKSIDTVGITAHGEIDDDEPPGNDIHDESMIPREAVDMEPDEKEYYMKLHRLVNKLESSIYSSSKESSKEVNTSDSKKVVSPVVSIKRIPTDEFMHWLSVGEETTSKQRKVSNPYDDIVRFLPSRRNSESSTAVSSEGKRTLIQSPVVSLRRLSPKDVSEYCKRDVSKSPTLGKVKGSKKRSISKSPTLNKVTKSKNDLERRGNRKSLISPIKLPKEMMLQFNRSIDTVERDGSQTRETTRNEITASTSQGNNTPVRKQRYFLRRLATEESSVDSKLSTSTRIEASRRSSRIAKQMQPLQDMKIRINEEVKSGPSLSSVEEWFKSSHPSTKKGVNVNATTRDVVENIMERLDTTLAEIHQKTTENFIKLFVDAQKKLNQEREQRQKSYEGVAAKIKDLLDEVRSLDDRSSRSEHQFSEWLKRGAADLVRADCGRKRAMVTLLRDDLQLILDNQSEE